MNKTSVDLNFCNWVRDLGDLKKCDLKIRALGSLAIMNGNLELSKEAHLLQTTLSSFIENCEKENRRIRHER